MLSKFTLHSLMRQYAKENMHDESSVDWREELTDEEYALVQAWDDIYVPTMIALWQNLEEVSARHLQQRCEEVAP